MELLYQDACMVVCLKPPGVLSEDHGEQSMPGLLRAQCGGYIGAVHRLDRAVGGVMVFSRNEAATGKLIRAFQQSGEKQYLAAVAGDPGESGVLEDLLYHDARANKTFVVQRMRKGVRQARLRFQRLCCAAWNGQTLALVRVTLETGRTHQIRTQFASRGMPIAGDRRYGSRVSCTPIALWSEQISLIHPEKMQRMTFRHAPPDGFPLWETPEPNEKE